MDGGTIAIVVILALLLATIAALVAYLLYRPRDRDKKDKKKMRPDGKIATKYPDPPENGDVKVNIPEDGNGTMLPPYASRESLDEPKETKVDIEGSHSDSDKDSTPEDKGLLKEVKVEPRERAVDVGGLEQKAPETPPCSDDDTKKAAAGKHKTPSSRTSSSSSSSSSSSDSDAPRVTVLRDGAEKDARPKDGDGSKRKSGLSSSSSSSEDDDDTPEPMPLMDPHIVRQDAAAKDPADDDVVMAGSDPDAGKDDLVTNVLAAMKEKQDKTSTSSSSSSDEDGKKAKLYPVVVKDEDKTKPRRSSSSSSSSSDGEKMIRPKAVVEEEIVPTKRDKRPETEYPLARERHGKEQPLVVISSSDEEFDPSAERRKQVPKPTKRKKRPSLEKGIEHKRSSSSSSSSDDEAKVVIVPVVGRKKSSSSSSSSSDSDEAKRRRDDISTQTPGYKPDKKKKKTKRPATPPILAPVSTQTPTRKSSSSSSSSSDEEGRRVVPLVVPLVTKAKERSSSSSSSDSDGAKIPGEDISTQTMGVTPKRKKSKEKRKPTHLETLQATGPLTSSSSSSMKSDGDAYRRQIDLLYAKPHKPKKEGVPISTQTDKWSSTSTSSSSTSEAEIEFPTSSREEMSSQTLDMSTPKRKSKQRYEHGYEYDETSPVEGRKSSLKSASIASSESSDREMYRYGVGTPRVGPRPWSPTHGLYERPTSPQSNRSTQTLLGPRTKKPKRKKSKEPVRPPSPIIITMADKCIQTMKTSSSSSSSSSEDEGRVTKPKVIHVYEKGNQMTSPSSSSTDLEAEQERLRVRTERSVVVERVSNRVMVSTGTGTSATLERKAKKIVTSRAEHESGHEFDTINLDLGPEEQFKSETSVEIPPEPVKVTFTTSWGKSVDLADLYDAGVVDADTKDKLEAGILNPSDELVLNMVRPYITCNKPVAGVLILDTGEKLSINEAVKRGLIRRGTAISLLEAEVATGNLIDPVTGRRMNVAEAARDGFIDKSYEAILERAERAVHGYKPRSGDRMLSIFEAMKRGMIVESHGVRLLEAQLATGGIIDPKANHRLPLEAAYRRKLFDQEMMATLVDPSDDTKGFIDPNSEKNLTYLELMSICVTDQNTGVLLIPMETQTRGRSPTSSTTSVRSATSVEMKSPSRSRSEERVETIMLSLPKSSSSSSDEAKMKTKRRSKEIKSSSAHIKLVKTPVMSGDESTPTKKRYRTERERQVRDGEHHVVEAVVRRLEKDVEMPSDDERKRREVSETTFVVTETFAPVTMEVRMKEGEKEEKKQESSSSSSIDDDKKQVVTTEDDKDSKSEFSTTTTVVETTEVTTTKRRSRHDIKFKSGWNRKASLLDLFAAGVVTNETVENLEQGTITEEDVEKKIQHYLVGEEPIAGILVSETGEKISIYSAWRKGLIRRGTSISLLEAQAATGRILDPKTGERYSVEEASKKALIDRGFEAVLARAERAVYGYTTRLSSDILSLFQAMKRGIVIENHGIRLLEAQIATGGIIDPNANHRLPVEVAYERNLFDERMNQILEDPSDDTRGFFDPNTEENLTYLELMERCIFDQDTGMRLLPLRTAKGASATRKRTKVVFESRTGRQVTVQDLLNAERIDLKAAERFEKGEMSSEESNTMVAKLRVFVDGTMPIAGVINTDTGDRMSIYEAAKCGLIRRGTAFELLEAQACCGKVIDVQSGRIVTIETALRSGIIDREFKDVVERAHRAVTGYREPFKRELLSLCEAINRHLIVRRHGIRLLEAQIATGGIIDVKSPVRIDVDVALKRALIDAKLAEELSQKLTQSYFDPVTGENLNYSEMMGRCVTDKDTGLLYLMVEGGTVTGYVRPFEPEHSSKIRSTSASPGRVTTEEMTTRSMSASSRMSTEEYYSTTYTSETSSSTKKKKKKSKRTSGESSTFAISGSESPSPPSPSIISRKVIIVDPDTNEEIDVQEALKRNLIDKETAQMLMAQQGDFEEQAT